MKLIIDIDENILNDAKNGHTRLGEIADAVLSGTPLPKGHGDLIDRNELLCHTKCTYKYDCPSGSDCYKCSDNCVEVYDIEHSKVIIPADEEVKND